MARSTIQDNLKRVEASGLAWPLASDLSDEVLEQRLFSKAGSKRALRISVRLHRNPHAASGLPVFPCIYAQKKPATKRGFYDATANPATVKRWFGGNYRRNLAVRTGLASGAWVLDVDQPAALAALEAAHGALPATRQSASSRGLHLWFRSTGIPMPCSMGRVAPGLDVKGEGGYVVAPPSIHPDGVVYEWLNAEPFAIAPEWLVALARKAPPSHPLFGRQHNVVRPVSLKVGACDFALAAVIASTPSACCWAVLIWRALPGTHRCQSSLLSRCTAMLAGLRTLIQTRHAPDR